MNSPTVKMIMYVLKVQHKPFFDTRMFPEKFDIPVVKWVSVAGLDFAITKQHGLDDLNNPIVKSGYMIVEPKSGAVIKHETSRLGTYRSVKAAEERLMAIPVKRLQKAFKLSNKDSK